MPDPATATNVPALLAALQASDPARPRITWYGADPGERVELSARVLANWVAKSANLLVDEFDAGPDTSVALELSSDHWRTLALGLAVSATGALLTSDDADIRVTSEGADHEGDLVVALAPLARSATPPPARALDFAAVITGYDDVFLPSHPVRLAAGAPTTQARARVLLGRADSVSGLIETVVDVLRADGSVVIGHFDPDRLPAILEQEQVDDVR